MSFIRTVIVGTDPLSQLLRRKQAVGFDHGALAMDPLGFNRIEPGALGGQKQGQNAYAFACGFHLLVVVPNPGTHDLAVMPGGIIPDQQPSPFALGLQLVTAPVQKLRRDVTDGTPIDKAQGHLVAKRGLSRSSLPQDAITGQRFGIGISLLPPLLDKANGVLPILPGMGLRQGKATPPHFIQEANGPVGSLFLLRSPVQQSVTSCFFSVRAKEPTEQKSPSDLRGRPARPGACDENESE